MTVKLEKRFYRELVKPKGKVCFEISAGESDIWIAVPEKFTGRIEELKEILTEHLILVRTQVQNFIKLNPEFLTSLKPLDLKEKIVPSIIKLMVESSRKANVGPMAGIAGAINYFLGEKLKGKGIQEFILENGGDLYVKSSYETVIGIFTGNPELDRKIGVLIPPGEKGICSSSSKIGHSISLGRTIISTVISKNPILSDCAATALGNSKTVEEFSSTFDSIEGLTGAFGLIDGKIVIKGKVKFAKLEEK